MKQNILVYLVIILFVFALSSCSAISKPKSKKVGGISGKIILKLDKDFENFNSGKYKSNVKLWFKNKDNDKEYTTYVSDGYYYLLNIPPGNYDLINWKIKNAQGDWIHGELTDMDKVESNIETKAYINNILVQEHTVTVCPNAIVKFAFPNTQCNKDFCYLDYLYLNTNKPNKKNNIKNMKEINLEAYKAWNNFNWVELNNI